MAMDYNEVRKTVSDLLENNEKEFVMAIISLETGINDINILEAKYEMYKDFGDLKLLTEEFYM